jgi:hypothetical protein
MNFPSWQLILYYRRDNNLIQIFESLWGHCIFSIDLILPAAAWSWGLLILYHKWVPGIFLVDKARPARKVDNLASICEPIV